MQSSRRVAQVAEVDEVVEVAKVARVTKSCTKSPCGQINMEVTVATYVARRALFKGALPLVFRDVKKTPLSNQIKE